MLTDLNYTYTYIFYIFTRDRLKNIKGGDHNCSHWHLFFMASVWFCTSQTELSNRSHHWKHYTTVKMSFPNAFPFQNMRHFVQIPEISEMASRHFGSDIDVILFSFWLIFEVHSHCLILLLYFYFFFENQSLYFSCSALFFISVESFFSSHLSFDLYIPPAGLETLPFSTPSADLSLNDISPHLGMTLSYWQNS